MQVTVRATRAEAAAGRRRGGGPSSASTRSGTFCVEDAKSGGGNVVRPSVDEQGRSGKGASGEAAIMNGGGGLFVGPPFNGMGDGVSGSAEERVDRSGELGGQHPPRVAVFQVGSLMGQHDPSLGGLQGTQQPGRDDDAASALRSGEGVGSAGVDHDQRAGAG